MVSLFVLLVPARVAVACAPAAAAINAQQPQAPDAASREQERAAGAAAEEHRGSGWLAVIAKIVNFAILAFILAYFLRTPIAEYLASRSTQIREDLVTAAATREAARRQLADIDSKLQALPAELEALKARGADEIAAERVRIEQAAEAERQRLLDQARRDIDARLRLARRELLEHAANLAVRVAEQRIRVTITPEDQTHLVDRYVAQLAEAQP
jgi:F-type H+-transporting ATPase subunit b